MSGDGGLLKGRGSSVLGGITSRFADLVSERDSLPEVVEEDSEACWALWEELADREMSAKPVVQRHPHDTTGLNWDAETAPADLHAMADVAIAAPAGPLTVGTVLSLSKKNNRVCPMPGQWLMLHDILTLNGTRKLKPYPPEPVSGRAWVSTSSMNKRIRMRDQIMWAADYGGLSSVHDFLQHLAEDEWLHVGE
jgi:hypothetical protein